MSTRLHAISLAVSFALTLSACDGGSKKPEGSAVATPAPTKPVGVTPEPVKPKPVAAVTVAVASVQLIQDCPDPAAEARPAAADVPAAGAAADAAPAMPAPGAAQAKMGAGASAARMAPGSNWKPPCTQSTMQLALRNPGKQDATLRVEAVRLVDAGSKKVLGPVAVRKPSVWSAEGTYRPWDEKVSVGVDLKIGYRLGEPDWAQVEKTLGSGVNTYAQPFVLEVDVSIDGTRQTVRSPEFVREQVHMIAT